MAGTKSLNKRARAAERKRLGNRVVKSRTKTAIGKARKAVSGGQVEPAQAGVEGAVRSIDRAVSKGIFHRNKAARLKSRFARKMNALVAAAPAPEPVEDEEKPAKKRTRRKSQAV
ncbi:MAG: 30S ribosomal protein S20 [Dehalococcoidia bacterium]|nr:30S ribosomal protein S20 [Dehalococcoidia bacterium]